MGDQHSRIDSMFQSKEVTVNGGHTGWFWPNCECKKTHLFMTQLWCGDGSKAIIPICGGVNIHKPVIFGYKVLTHLHVTYNDHQPKQGYSDWFVQTHVHLSHAQASPVDGDVTIKKWEVKPEIMHLHLMGLHWESLVTRRIWRKVLGDDM